MLKYFTFTLLHFNYFEFWKFILRRLLHFLLTCLSDTHTHTHRVIQLSTSFKIELLKKNLNLLWSQLWLMKTCFFFYIMQFQKYMYCQLSLLLKYTSKQLFSTPCSGQLYFLDLYYINFVIFMLATVYPTCSIKGK